MKKRKKLTNNKKMEKETKSQAKKEKQDDKVFSYILKDLRQLKPDLI